MASIIQSSVSSGSNISLALISSTSTSESATGITFIHQRNQGQSQALSKAFAEFQEESKKRCASLANENKELELKVTQANQQNSAFKQSSEAKIKALRAILEQLEKENASLASANASQRKLNDNLRTKEGDLQKKLTTA